MSDEPDKPDKPAGETGSAPALSNEDVQPADHLPGGAARVARAANKATDDVGVPKLPRGRGGFSISMGQLVKIGLTAGVLVMVLVIQRPCSDAVSGFVTDFDGKGSNARMPKPDNMDLPRGSQLDPSTMESIQPGMSEAEVKAAIDRARAKAAASMGSGGAGAGSAGVGSAGPGSAVGSAGGDTATVPALFAPW